MDYNEFDQFESNIFFDIPRCCRNLQRFNIINQMALANLTTRDILEERGVGVQSECGKLDIVVMHRPGKELLRLTEHNLHHLLYDALPNINDTHHSHDIFSQYLRDQGVHVLYLTDLLRETFTTNAEARNKLIDGIVAHSHLNHSDQQQASTALRQWLLHRTPEQLAQDVIVGVACTQDELGTSHHAQELLKTSHLNHHYVINPLPNLLFMRDGFSIMEKNVFIWQMNKPARRNEPYLLRLIFQYHPQLSTSGLKIIEWETQKHKNNKNQTDDDDNEMATIEGGDVAYLGEGVVMIGCSERTNRVGIEKLARTGLFRQVIAINIPPHRCYMHLDTVLSSVGKHAFTLHGSLAERMEVFTLEKKDGEVEWVSHGCNVREALRKLLNDDELVFYDALDEETSIEEQRQCRHNVVVIDNYHVATYSGSDPEKGIVTQMIRNNECRVKGIPPQGLSEGGGGVHCMTNAIRRRRTN